MVEIKKRTKDGSADYTNTDQINWIVACVNEFAKGRAIKPQDAFRYLYDHGGISFMIDHYEAEHLLSFEDAVDDLTRICAQNGGEL